MFIPCLAHISAHVRFPKMKNLFWLPAAPAHWPKVPGGPARFTLSLVSLSALMWVAAPTPPAVAAPRSDARPRGAVPEVSRGESYVLGAGDGLRVVVTGYPEFSQDAVTIPPDGTVTLPNFGTVRLSGKTRLAVQRELTLILQRKVGLRQPAVAVSITQFRSSVVGSVVLAGDVPRSGTFDIRAGYRLSDLLADAGLQVRLEERQASLTRRGGVRALNLKAAAASPRGGADILLRPGDSITVRQSKAGRITLLGDLMRSGVYEIHRNPLGEMEIAPAARLSDLITKAGGLRSENAAVGSASNSGSGSNPGSAPAGNAAERLVSAAATFSLGGARLSYRGFLQRGGKRWPLDPEAALSAITGPANIRLQNNDVVTVQVVPPAPIPQPLTVYLDGLSNRTGSFQVAPGAGVYELIASAGGLTKAPDEIIASVRRGAQVLPLDLPTLLLSGASGANLKLENGDIVQLREPDTIEVQVAGRVARAGALRLKPGATILDALLAAGNLSIPPGEARLNVWRKAEGGAQRLLPADAAGIVSLRDISTNFALQNGD